MDFSVVVPTFNAEKYLKPCLDSIVSQKHNGKTEIILIDGASTDKTLEIARCYKDIIIVSEKDKGEPDAINKGMKLATGDIVAWLDADDLYEEDCFSCVEQTFKKHSNISWLYGKSYFINESGKKIRRIITMTKQWLQADYSYNKLCNLSFLAQPSVFMRRELQVKVGDLNIDYPLIFDYEYWLRVGKVNDPIFVNEYLSSMRAHDESISVKFSIRQMRESLDLVYRFKNKYHYWNYLVRMCILLLTIAYYKTVGKYI